MPEREYADIVPVLKNLCLALQPFAANRHIALCFSATEEKIEFYFKVNELLSDFSKLISSVIDYMPDNNALYIKAGVIEKKDTKYVSVKIHNTGINLKMVTALVNKSSLPVKLCSSSPNE